jgi:hypothetical protein
MQRTLAVLLCALVAGAAATDTTHPLISGIREHHEAAISGIRQHHEAAISGLRAKFFSKHWMHHEVPAVSGAPGSTLTPTVVPTNCLSVAEVAQAAGNFSTLLAAAQVNDLLCLCCSALLICAALPRGPRSPPCLRSPLPLAGRWSGPRPVRPQPAGHRVCPH